jgi:putative membrane protein insertion efficiency factor
LNCLEASVEPAESKSASAQRTGVARWLLLFAVRVYRGFFSPFFGAACRFHPSCSQYAFQAVERWGARRGAWLALKRLGRCRPFSQGGYDPVPELAADENSGSEAVRSSTATTGCVSGEYVGTRAQAGVPVPLKAADACVAPRAEVTR